MAKRLFQFLALVGVAMGHEHHGTTLFPRAEKIAPPSFGYHGITGPLNWYTLNKTSNRLCAQGTHQSPIDLGAAGCKSSQGLLSINYDNAPNGAEFINLGTTVEVFANGTLSNNGVTSSLVQFHFHSPSEHSIDGEFFPLEVHFVHQAADATLSVVGFVIEVGKTLDPLLGAVAASLKDIPSLGNTTTTKPLDFGKLEQHVAQHGIFQYSGSLTTPPCTEDVSWTVSCAPLTVDVDTFNAFKKNMKFNARYTQNTPGEINLLENIAHELD